MGLCHDCANAQRVTSTRGGTFILCRLSSTDPSYPKYPRLPVLVCDGFRAADPPDKPGNSFGSQRHNGVDARRTTRGH